MSQTMKTLNGYEIVDNYARTQITAEKAALKQEIATERKRIDALASLPEGSTAGDAELVDAHIDYTGKNWESTGAHIRGVTSQLSKQISDVIDDTMVAEYGKNRCPEKLYDGYIKEDGQLEIYSDWKTTDFIYVGDLEKVITSMIDRTDGNRIGVGMYFFTTYDINKNMLSQVNSQGNKYEVEENVAYIRFSIKSDTFTEPMVESGKVITDYEPYSKKYKSVNDDYALKVNTDYVEKEVNALKESLIFNYKVFDVDYVVSPSCIWNEGEFETNLEYTSRTEMIDCSEWLGIKYTGESYLGCRAIAFYDSNKKWILSYPEVGETTKYNDFDIVIPNNAKYVIFGDFSKKTGVNANIKVAKSYRPLGKWFGKKWVCIGDSLTEKNSRTKMNYHDYVAEATDITVVNMGHSGSGYKRSEDDGNSFYQRSNNIPTDADVITIFGSGNDLKFIDSLGTYLDTGTETLGGCINTTIDNIIRLKPNVSLGIVSPTPWVGNQPTVDDSNAMARYTELLRQICKVRSIPFLDLYHCSNLRPWTDEGRNTCYTKDDGNGVHPDENGHKLIAPGFKAFLETLIM